MLSYFRRRAPESVHATALPGRAAMEILDSALDDLGSRRVETFSLPSAPPSVIPASAKLAVDQAIGDTYRFAGASQVSEGMAFLGYPYLSELCQRPEYRRPSEILANEMTRKWLRIASTGDEGAEDKSDRIRRVEAEFKRLGVQAAFRRAAEQDGFFGRSQIFLELDGGHTPPEELEKPLLENPAKLGDGLTALRVVEPQWTYPAEYNADRPLRDDYFRPRSWYVQGDRVHASRLLTFVSRPVPDILKPAYAFGGLSLSQIAKPYVDNWLRTRQSVSDAVFNFSTSVLKTNMSSVLDGGAAASLWKRIKLFSAARNNSGVMVLDKNEEDFSNVSMPLSGLHELQAQAQEHMAAVTGIPLVKLLGITPSGLNASSDGEIRSFYDWVESLQEAVFSPHVERLLRIVQIYLFGEVDPEIGFQWEPLWSLDEGELATARKTEADTDIAYIDAGVISPQEARARLAAQEDSPYAALDVDDLPDAPEGGEEFNPEDEME